MDIKKEAQEFVDEKTEEIKVLYKTVQLAYFNAITSGKEEFYKQYEESKLKLERLFNNKENFEKAKAFDSAVLKDKLLARQIKLLKNAFLGSQGDMELIKEIVKKSSEAERKFNVSRPQINGKLVPFNEINRILKEETDNKILQEAWEAYKSAGTDVGKDVIELVKLRNKLARSLGYDNVGM